MPVPKYWLLGSWYPRGLTVQQERHRPSGSNNINGTNFPAPDAHFEWITRKQNQLTYYTKKGQRFMTRGNKLNTFIRSLSPRESFSQCGINKNTHHCNTHSKTQFKRNPRLFLSIFIIFLKDIMISFQVSFWCRLYYNGYVWKSSLMRNTFF